MFQLILPFQLDLPFDPAPPGASAAEGPVAEPLAARPARVRRPRVRGRAASEALELDAKEATL